MISRKASHRGFVQMSARMYLNEFRINPQLREELFGQFFPVSIEYIFHRSTFLLLLEHPNFKVVEAGEIIPCYQLIIHDKIGEMKDVNDTRYSFEVVATNENPDSRANPIVSKIVNDQMANEESWEKFGALIKRFNERHATGLKLTHINDEMVKEAAKGTRIPSQLLLAEDTYISKKRNIQKEIDKAMGIPEALLTNGNSTETTPIKDTPAPDSDSEPFVKTEAQLKKSNTDWWKRVKRSY